MKHHRAVLGTIISLLLVGCVAGGAPGVVKGGGLAPLPSPAQQPRVRRDLVTTLGGEHTQANDIMIDGEDRLYTVTDRSIARLENDGRSRVVVASSLPLDVSPEDRDRQLYYPLFATVARDGSMYALGLADRLYKMTSDGSTVASYPLPDVDYISGADVVADSRGNVYFTVATPDYAPDGGTSWIGKLTPDGTVTAFAGDRRGPRGFADGVGSAAKFDGPSALAIDAFDNLYVADRWNRSIRRITPEGVVTTVAGRGRPQLPPSPMPGLPSPDLAPLFEGTLPVVTLTVTRSGDLIYATTDNRLWRVSPDGVAEVLAGTGRPCRGVSVCPASGDCPPPPPVQECWTDGPAASAEFNGILALAAQRDGTIYALDGRGAVGGRRLRRIEWPQAPDPSVVRPGPTTIQLIRPVPPAPTPAPSATPRPNLALPSCSPDAVCPTVEGRVYDQEGHPVTRPLEVRLGIAGDPATITRVGTLSNGGYRITWPSSGHPLELIIGDREHGERRRLLTGRRQYANPVGPNGAPPGPPRVELNFGGPPSSNDPDAPVFFLPPAGTERSYLPPSPILPFERSTVTTLAGTGKDETFSYVSGLDLRPDGRVVVAVEQRNAIMEVTPTGAARILAGGPYDAPYGREQYLLDGQGASAHFYAPNDVALDAAGNAYVTDMSNSAIRKVTPDGTVTTLAGSRNWGYADGQGASARFMNPRGIAVGRSGTIFVADTDNHCIRAIAPDGQVSTFAGTNAPGWANGPRASARFRSPTDLAVGPDGSLYVADSGNHRLRRISPDGAVSDAYGTPHNAPDGTAVFPALDELRHVAVNAQGDLFTAEQERVFRITPAGNVTILAGYGLWGYADGTAETAYFAGISGLALDTQGTVYVSEYGNGRIRKIQPQ